MTRALYLEAVTLHPRPVHGDHSEAHPHELEAAEAGLLPGGGVVQSPLRDADPGAVTAPEAATREKVEYDVYLNLGMAYLVESLSGSIISCAANK